MLAALKHLNAGVRREAIRPHKGWRERRYLGHLNVLARCSQSKRQVQLALGGKVRQGQAMHNAAYVQKGDNTGSRGRPRQQVAVDESGRVGQEVLVANEVLAVQVQQKKRSNTHEFDAERIDNFGAAPPCKCQCVRSFHVNIKERHEEHRVLTL